MAFGPNHSRTSLSRSDIIRRKRFWFYLDQVRKFAGPSESRNVDMRLRKYRNQRRELTHATRIKNSDRSCTGVNVEDLRSTYKTKDDMQMFRRFREARMQAARSQARREKLLEMLGRHMRSIDQMKLKRVNAAELEWMIFELLRRHCSFEKIGQQKNK